MREHFMHITNLIPFIFLRDLTPINPLILNYHVVSDNKLPHIVNLYNYRNVSQFNQDLDFLIRYFHPISLTDFLNFLHKRRPLPLNSFLLTFDDGFREIYDIVAPILLKKNLTATFFLTSNYIDNRELGYDAKKSLIIDYLSKPENSQSCNHISSFIELENNDKSSLYRKILSIPYHNRFLVDKIASEINLNFNSYLDINKPYLTSDQIHNLLKKGFTFGAHSIDHPRFAELPLDDQINQVFLSIQKVTDRFSLHYRVFAFPYSDNKVTVDFFNHISSEVEATFGTNGIAKDQIKTNFQRVSVEKFNLKASKVLKFHFTRKIIYQMLGKDIIIRSNAKKSN